MPLDLEKIKTLTGINSETDEDFAEQFNKKFLTEDQIFKDEPTRNRIFGKTLGSVKTGIKKIFGEVGVNFSSEELEKGTPEAITQLGAQRMNEFFANQKTELEKTAGLSADEKIREAQETIGKLNSKIKDYDTLVKQKATEFESLNQASKNELKNYKRNSVYKDVFGSINWNPDKDDYSRTGFIAKMKEKYTIDLEDDDNDFIVDNSTGQRIKADGSHSTFMKPKDVIKMEAEKAGMAAINKNAGKLVNKAINTTEQKTITKSVNQPAGGRKQMASTRFQQGQ